MQSASYYALLSVIVIILPFFDIMPVRMRRLEAALLGGDDRDGEAHRRAPTSGQSRALQHAQESFKRREFLENLLGGQVLRVEAPAARQAAAQRERSDRGHVETMRDRAPHSHSHVLALVTVLLLANVVGELSIIKHHLQLGHKGSGVDGRQG